MKNKKGFTVLIVLMFSLLVVWLLSACKTPVQTSSSTSDSTIYVEKIKIVPVYTPPDSAWYWAWFKCDSTGHVIMTNSTEVKTNNVSSSVLFNDGKFNYKIKTVHDTVKIPVKETSLITKSNKSETITVEVIKMSLFQKIFFWIGIFSTLAVGIFVFMKFRNNTI